MTFPIRAFASLRLPLSVVLALATAGALPVVGCAKTETGGFGTDGSDAGSSGGGGSDNDACAIATRPSPASLDPASYDQTCRAAADCFPVTAGALACPGECVACPTAAVSAVGNDAYSDDQRRATALCRPDTCVGQVACAPCPSAVVACESGKCTLRNCNNGDCGDAGTGGVADAARD